MVHLNEIKYTHKEALKVASNIIIKIEEKCNKEDDFHSESSKNEHSQTDLDLFTKVLNNNSNSD